MEGVKRIGRIRHERRQGDNETTRQHRRQDETGDNETGDNETGDKTLKGVWVVWGVVAKSRRWYKIGLGCGGMGSIYKVA